MGLTRPLIVDVKRHSFDDGPGIRSVVFFKGCPLRCVFCHNPETQSPEPEIAFSARHCIGCGECAEACPHGAIDLGLPGRIRRQLCVRCGACARACPGRGLRLIGTHHTPEGLAEILLRDRAFYRHSGGGVTLSGGECTMHPDYLELLLDVLKRAGVHVVLQTSGFFGYEVFERKILPYLDLIFYDLKIADRRDHERWIGASNEQVLANFRRLVASRAVEVVPRIPVVPGITATRRNLAAIVDFLTDADADRVSLLPYNPMGIEMYECLGRRRPPLPATFMKPQEQEAIGSMFEAIVEAPGNAVAPV